MPGQRAPLVERFWAKVDRSGGFFACWPWTGAITTSRNGTQYGHIRVGGRGTAMARAHRVALVLKTDEDPPDLEAGHGPACTTSLCCNPEHLRWVTRAENEADKAARRLDRAFTAVEAGTLEDDPCCSWTIGLDPRT